MLAGGPGVAQATLDDIVRALTYSHAGASAVDPVTLTYTVNDGSGTANATTSASITIEPNVGSGHVVDYSAGSANNPTGAVPDVSIDVLVNAVIEDRFATSIFKLVGDVIDPVGTNVAYAVTDDFTIIGTSGRDNIGSGLGNDVLRGGGDADVQLSRAGNDTFLANVSDLVSGEYIDGGDDTDTLVITIGVAETVNLTGVTITNVEAAQFVVTAGWVTDFSLLDTLFTDGVQTATWSRSGFDYSAVRTGGNTVITLTDTLNQRSYASRIDTWNAAGTQQISSHVLYDDGSIADLTFVNGIRSHQVLTDNPLVPGANGFSSVVTDWDASGVLTHRFTTYDSGSTLDQTYQPDGARTDINTDVGNLQAYVTETNSFNAAGQLTGSTDVFDGGNTQQYFYTTPGVLSSTVLTDTDANENFSMIEILYNPAGGVTGRTTTYDNTDTFAQTYFADGSHTDVKTDNAHLQNYVTTSTTFAADGRATSAHDVYDNGNTADFFYFPDGKPQRNVVTDTNNDDAFQTITTTFSPTVHGQIETTVYLFDNNTSWINGSAIDNTLVGADNRYDIITGYDGNDTMTGGIGADQFWYNGTGWGNDVITDFQLGLDQIDLRGVSGAHPLSLSTVQSGADTVISYTNGATTSTITLQNVLATSLVPHDVLM